jgi:hypothetical protein
MAGRKLSIIRDHLDDRGQEKRAAELTAAPDIIQQIPPISASIAVSSCITD